jgi:hypothetical protein
MAGVLSEIPDQVRDDGKMTGVGCDWEMLKQVQHDKDRDMYILYKYTAMKHIPGTMYEKPMLPLPSETKPCKPAITAPPKIAMIIPLPPIFVSLPKPVMLIPYIVGNINDMKKDIKTNDTTPT